MHTLFSTEIRRRAVGVFQRVWRPHSALCSLAIRLWGHLTVGGMQVVPQVWDASRWRAAPLTRLWRWPTHTHTHTHVSPDPIITHTNFWGHSWSLPSTWHHQLYFDSVGHQDSQDLLVGDVLDAERQNKAWQLHNWGDTPVHTPVRSELHGGGGQVGVFVLELPIQGQAPFFTVLVKRWGQSVHFAECRAGRHLITDNSTSSCQSKAQGSLGQSAHRHPNTQVPQIKHLCTFELLIYYSCS